MLNWQLSNHEHRPQWDAADTAVCKHRKIGHVISRHCLVASSAVAKVNLLIKKTRTVYTFYLRRFLEKSVLWIRINIYKCRLSQSEEGSSWLMLTVRFGKIKIQEPLSNISPLLIQKVRKIFVLTFLIKKKKKDGVVKSPDICTNNTAFWKFKFQLVLYVSI